METQETRQDRPTGGVREATEASRSVGVDHQEVEWQFDVADLGEIEVWLEGERPPGLGFSVVAGTGKDLADTYYDTEGWRLYRAGYALRVRRGERRGGRGGSTSSEATIKSLASASADDARRRREVTETFRGDEVGALLSKKRPGPVGEIVEAIVGRRELRPLFEVRTGRRVFDLYEGSAGENFGEIVEDASGNIRRSGEAARVGEVALDATEILVGGETVHLTRVEVETDTGTDSSGRLEGFVEAMREDLRPRPATASKFEAGLSAAGFDPGAVLDFGPDAVDGTLSVGEVAFRVLRRQFARMRAHEPGTRLGEDPEELHDMRVATRRLRSALKLFEDVLPEEARRIRAELKYFAGVMGDVRDLDVQIEDFRERTASQSDEDEHLRKVVSVLESRRRPAREVLVDALDSRRYECLESDFAAVLRRGPEDEAGLDAGGRSDEPVLAAAPDLLSRPYRKWSKAAKRVDEGSSPEEYHDLRKKGKRLRYALEFLSGVYGKTDTGRLVKPLKALQDELGRHQDLIVTGELLENLAAEGRGIPPRTAFAMGALAQRCSHEAREIRASVTSAKEFRRLSKGKPWKDFEKTMKKRLEKSEAKAKARAGKGKKGK